VKGRTTGLHSPHPPNSKLRNANQGRSPIQTNEQRPPH